MAELVRQLVDGARPLMMFTAVTGLFSEWASGSSRTETQARENEAPGHASESEAPRNWDAQKRRVHWPVHRSRIFVSIRSRNTEVS